MSDLEGVMLSDYLLLQCISKGGVADVYRARQNGQGNYEVAVKIFRPGYAQQESFRNYFMTEAEKIGQFDHPNILPFLEFGEGEGLLYVVTPFVASGTLDDLLKRVGGKFTAMQAVPIVQQLCSAVQYAHDRDVIHGNIKPTNIFVAADGRMLLSDFGIARSYDDSQQSLTRVGWGSAEYAAPEQSLGVLRKSSDIYTLGVLLFRILTGQPPFSGQTPVEVLLKHVRQPTPSARSFGPSISDTVDSVLSIAMQKRSDNRYSSAEELSNAFLAAVNLAPVASPVAKSVPLVDRGDQRESVSSGPNQADPYRAPLLVDPHTPLPPPAMFTSPSLVSPSSEEQFGDYKSNSSLASSQEPARPSFPLLSNSAGEVGASLIAPDSDITEIRKKSSFAENNESEFHPFWSAEPVEWSPLWSNGEPAPGKGSEQASLPGSPSTANEYLRSMPVVPEVSPVLPPLEKSNQESSSTSVLDRKRSEGTASKPELSSSSLAKKNRSEARLRKILPIVVVILLLLGLLAALLSSFLFPSFPSNNSIQSPVAFTGSSVGAKGTMTTSRGHAATPTSVKGIAPASTATSVARPTEPVPTPVPTTPAVPAFSCTSGSIALDGSDNFQPVITQLASDYDGQCANSAHFIVSGDGSKAGLDAVASSNIDLAYSDLSSAGRPTLVNYAVATIIYAVLVNTDTRVTNLTMAQLKGIYTGQFTNWSQVGGSNEPITIITRSNNSTIRTVFETDVLKGTKQTVAGTELGSKYDSNTLAVQNVEDVSGAISYIPLSAVPTASSQAQSITINGVNAAVDSVTSGGYPFWSIEHLYTNSAAIGLALSFISFCLTSTGATDLTSFGAVPIKNMTSAALNSHSSDPTV